MKIGILLGWLGRICYAKKFRGWNSSSGWKIPTTRFRWLVLLAMMCIMPWQGAKAYWSWDEGQSNGSYKSTVRWDKENGVIKYHIRVWQDWGSGVGNGHCYMDGVTITQKGVSDRKVTITVNDKSDWDATTLTVEGHSKGPYSWCQGPSSGDNTYFWDFDLPVDQGDLNGVVSIKMSGVWHGNGWTNHDKISESTTLNINYPQASLEIVKAGYSCSSPQNDPLIYFDWKNTATDNLAKNGTVYLCDADDKDLDRTIYIGETSVSATNGKFRINAGLDDKSGDKAIHNLNNSHSYKIRHVYTPSGNTSIHYISESKAVMVNAYPQVSSVSYDEDKKNSKIKATWSVKRAPSSNISGNFIVMLERLGPGESILRRDTAKVAYKEGKTDYEAPFDLDLGVDTLSYRIRVTRENPEGESSACYSSRFEQHVVTKMLSTDHIYVSGTPYAELKDDSTSIVIRWNRKGSQWSEGTQFSVRRRELGKDREDEFILSEDDFNNQVYVDELATRCKAYEYQLVLTPGNTSYKEQKVQVKVSGRSGNLIFIPYIGSVDGFESSKGHYSDKVKLSWAVTSGLDKVVIERRECDNSDSQFMFVNSVEVSNSTTYFYDDKSCQPGVLYEYRLFGVVNCGTDTISTDTLRNYGFRIPSGNFYGRITYENGQAVNSVRVGLETDDDLSTSALEFEGDGEAVIPGHGIMEDATSVTMQAWVYPSASSTDTVVLISKDGYYELGLDNDTVYFIAGNVDLKLTEKLPMEKYTHITAVCDSKSNQLRIYLNGKLSSKTTDSVSIFFSSAIVGSDVVLGRKFNGQMDEVRLWSRTLDSMEIADDYTRYLLGNENGLDAYYTFDFMVASREENGKTTKPGQIYDCSYDGIENFHENSGELYKVKRADSKLTSNQLAYSGVTDSSGVYNIRSVPYYGNGTAYKLIPKKGIHQFSPSQEVRFVGDGTLSHTVNFTDNSSFLVHGVVYYSGGDYPVEGVHFTIDGVPALDKTGQYVMTGANGVYSINVPVGIHEVKAVKEGHTFELDGRICDMNGNDLNYQDIVPANLYDNTKVKYIGRVCGGTIQEDYPVGFSLSKNNLADDMKVILSPTKTNCSLQKEGNVHSDTIKHPVFQYQLAKGVTQTDKSTVCDYNEKNITIHVNNETGEFIAWVYPIEYNVKLEVYGHQDIMGDNSSLNLSTYAINQYETYKQKDSVFNEQGIFERIDEHTDSLAYRQKQVFTKRYRAKMEVVQLEGDKELSYFGKRKVDIQSVTDPNEKTVIPLYDESSKTYTFGLPVFVTNDIVNMRYTIFEEYPYYVDNNMNTDESKKDRVYIDGASVSFNNKMACSSKLDSANHLYSFKVNEPDMTTAKSTISATFTYGDSDNPTSVSWENPLGNANGEAYILGKHQTGTDFVTAGPDKLLCVLRDPPGSNSYSYLEKGTSFTQSSTYNGAFNHEGSEMWTTGFKMQSSSVTLTGLGAATGTSNLLFETGSGIKAGIVQEAEYTGSNSKSSSYTLTTRIQTSDDPAYVGADADLYVGYSTNISFGTTQNVTVYPISYYNEVGGDQYFGKTYVKTDAYAIVETSGISAIEEFNTMFAYPQIYIENTLLPNLISLRNSFILPMSEAEGKDKETLQALAESTGRNIYISRVPVDDPSFGESDEGSSSYDVYFCDKTKCDTVLTLNQSRRNWEKLMEENERIKVEAKKKDVLQNYSFHAGSNIEYSESYSSVLSSSHSFCVKLGVALSDDNKQTTAGAYVLFEYEEQFTTTQGGEFESEAEASHSKGFVLAEDGDDYLSVDVIQEPILEDIEGIYNPEDSASFKDETYVDWVNAGSADTSKLQKKDFYPTFVFITRGGATSCPYEGAYVARHYKDGEIYPEISTATKRIEVPKIDMPVKYIENVPSGEAAFLTVRMMNESETGADQRFDLSLMDASNPNGAVPTIDGNSMSGKTLSYYVPAGDVLEKKLAVYKGSVLNYDHLKLILSSQCQEDIADTVDFTVHFIPSCTKVAIVKPTNNWTYNTNCSTDTIDGVAQHYMPITLSGFDVNYTDFDHLELQYKPTSSSDNDWLTLAYYYKSDTLAQAARNNGFNAFVISSEDAGNIYYNFYMDNLPDQNYDLRAVSFCNINNVLYDNPSEVVSGIKDMYNPRLFGSPKPANGVLSIEDDIRINFNETIAEGMLSLSNFEITGVRNGAVSDHSVAISLDGENDYLTTEVTRNFANKDLTFECWVNYDSLQNATFFSHGDAKESISMGMNKEGKVVVKVGKKELVSENVPAWEKSSWNHVALVYDNDDERVTAYVNYTAVIDAAAVNAYYGDGVVEVGRNVANQSGNFNGKVDQFRIWNSVRSSATIQVNSASQLSGNDLNLIAYYEMDEAKGSATEDKARGANLVMKGGSWSLPEGRSAKFNGDSYVAMNSSSAVITSDMDFTLEFWFNAESEAKDQTLISNGTGLVSNAEDASKLFSVGFDQTGALTFRHNGYVTPLEGDFSDNNWHNFTLAVNRSTGIARIYVDGELNAYFSADKVGCITSDKLFAGARVYYATNDSTAGTERKADQKFTGMIDEVRLWNLYRQQSQVENFYNQKLNGDEMGLLLYYPFEHYVEWQGRSEMQFTLEDKGNDALDGNGKKLAFATMQGEVSESQNIPPVKTKGATSSLMYDWVVNDDALIINLQEQEYRVEKTIVNFTVKGVQDMNGNYIVSPITWSAYIDRNQLKWMDDAVTVNKKQNEPYKFEMPIVNKGGSVINYSLKNMPSWLSASTESGSINPLEKQTIEFEIDPSLAVGTYDEVVYLTNSNNVTEPLALKVTVEGDTPEWSVDPSKYEFSMAVFAQIKLDNQFSNDEKDMLAAFYNGECVGVANMSYDKNMDLWYAMLTVYSNTKSHGLVYRAWDASKGIMTEALSSPVVSFEADTVYGKPTAPVVFYNGDTKYQNISLSKGWNWVSFNLENKAGMSDLTDYLNSGKWGSNSIVKDLSGHSANYSVESGKWLNDSLVLNNTSMFKIYSDENQVLSVSGSDINLDSTMIPVKAGAWNYIAYLPAGSMTLKAALAGYEAKEGDVIKSNEGFAMYYGNEWIGSLNSLQPNCGYMLKNTGNVQKTFKYPSSSSALRSAVSVESSAYESNMSIIASAPEKREGDLLRALVGTEENKIVEVALSDDYALQFINVSAKAGDKVRFTMERDGVTYEANNALTFTGDAVYGTPDHPFVLNFNVGGVETLTVYPNPMDVELNVAGKLDGEGDVTLELFDVLGVLVFEKQVSASDNVLNESINVSGLVPGSYMLKVSQGDESKVFKVVKK